MAISGVIGNLSILIGADLTGLSKGVADAEKKMKTLDASSAGSAKMLGAVAGIAAAAAVALGVNLVRSSLDVIDTQSKLARQLGGTVTGVQTLARVAELADVPFEVLSKSMEKLNRKLGEALRDTSGPVADAFNRLGLSAAALSKMDVDQRMATIADRIKKVGLSAQQTSDFIGQLGIRQGQMAGIFENGGKAFAEARAELVLWGVAVSNIDGEKIEQANDAMTVFGLALKGIGNQLAADLAAPLAETANAFRAFVEESGGMGNVVSGVLRSIYQGLGVIPNAIKTIRLAWDETISFFIDGANTIVRGLNKIGEFIPGSKGIEELTNSYGKLRAEIGDPLDIEGVGRQWDEMQKRATEAAKKGIEERKALKKGDGSGLNNLSSKEREQLENRLLSLKQSVASEDMVLSLHHDKQLKDLKEFEDKRIITGQAATDLRAKIDEDFAKKTRDLIQSRLEEGLVSEMDVLTRKNAEQLRLINEFEANKTISEQTAADLRVRLAQKEGEDKMKLISSQWSGIASIVDTSMAAISSIMADEGNKGFTIMKAISMATALVKGFEAVVSAYAFGAKIGGPPLGAVMAGVAAAGTAATIAKLAGVGPKSGGGASGGGGAAAASGGGAAAAAAAPAVPQSLVVKGFSSNEFFSGDVVRNIAKKLVDFQKDGGEVFFEK